MTTDSKYLLDFDAYVKEHPDEIQEVWANQYKALMESKDLGVYNFIMQYIFM
jgi:succinate dehydrogenase flavin-adding protein (antitoxin of CptAB toxin-antitoxin module)